MPGSHGNENLNKPTNSAYISYSTSSESVTLPVGTTAVRLVATTKCWVKLGDPGETATAAAPSGEKVWVKNIVPVIANVPYDFPVGISNDNALVQVAVIRDASDGVLDVIAMRD